MGAQTTLPDASDDENGRWIMQPSIKTAAMHAIPFPDFNQGYVGLAVYELNQDHVARLVDAESEA